MNTPAIQKYVNRLWDESIIAELCEYIRIPNKSVAFDPQWREHGHMERVISRFERWVRAQNVEGLQLEVVRLPGRTPLIFMEIAGASDDGCVMLYGHLDKQPEMAGWRAGLDPWTPVIEGDRLYGRGAADDGYSIFACIAAISALKAENIPHARCVVIIEACEESGSTDLPAYIEHLASRIGNVRLVIGLDSGCGNYDQLWCTTSLRGLVGGTLKVEVLSEGIHSGASGFVPDSFRIARQLLSRVEDENTGRIRGEEFYAEIPDARRRQAEQMAAAIGDHLNDEIPFVKGMRPVDDSAVENLLNQTWRPALAIVGAEGLPPAANAGNVLRPSTSLKVSLRIPPTCDPNIATRSLTELLTSDPPYGAHVTFEPNWGARGWDAPATPPWLDRSLDDASKAFFGKPAAYMGMGGTIPFMSMLGERFPDAQFVITGVLGPHSNAHGPNEFLHIPTAKKLTCCVAKIIADHFAGGA